MEDIILTVWLSKYFWSWFWLLAYGMAILLCITIVIWADLTQRPLGRYMALSGSIYLAATVGTFIAKTMRFF
jgi:hypothetical protein